MLDRQESTFLSPVEQLTDRELEVAWHAALGCSYREIGQALHITINTVKKHLSHIYLKLGIARKRSLRRFRDDLQRQRGASAS